MADDRPLPTRIWTVEDYYRVKEFYEARGLVFNPPLERGSPALCHVIAQAELQQRREEAAATESFAHSSDFRSVRWFGTTYNFTANQAAVVKVLWGHWERGTPDVGDETLLDAVDHEAPPERFSSVFRSHPALGQMIVFGETKGTHRLKRPRD